MTSSLLLGITTFTYLLATLCFVYIFVFKAYRVYSFAIAVTSIALVIQTAGIGLRWYESYAMGIGHAPLTNMYESVVFFSWTIALLYLLMEWKFRTRILGLFALPFAFLAMAYGSFSTGISKEIAPLVPALQSNWLIAHVITCFVGYAAFTVSFGASAASMAARSWSGTARTAGPTAADGRPAHARRSSPPGAAPTPLRAVPSTYPDGREPHPDGSRPPASAPGGQPRPRATRPGAEAQRPGGHGDHRRHGR